MDKTVFILKAKQSCKIAVRRANEFLKPLDMSLSVNWDYDFNGFYCDAIGVYERWSVFEGQISVGCNINKLYEACEHNIESYPWSNPDTIIDETFQTNIFHEMGHGVVEQIEFYLNETDELDTLYDENKELFDFVFDNEEDAVEEFAWELYDNTPTNSRLGKLVRLFINLNTNVQEHKMRNENRTMAKKQVVRLNENQLRRIVSKSVKRVLSEDWEWWGGANDVFADCMRKLSEASDLLEADVKKYEDKNKSEGFYYDEDYYYQNFKGNYEAMEVIDKAKNAIADIGLNGRIGYFDENGYHSYGY